MICSLETCYKKISLSQSLIGKCKCGKVFCLKHRHSEEHNCSYNYQNEINKEKFIENNKCVNTKICII